jgi:hypothetical protein
VLERKPRACIRCASTLLLSYTLSPILYSRAFFILFLFFILFICAYSVWVISPLPPAPSLSYPAPSLSPLLHTLFFLTSWAFIKKM